MLVRKKSRVPSSSSRELIWWLTAGWVMCSCSAAREKLRKLATAKKHSSWVVFMGKPPEFRPFCGITMRLNYKRAL